jgi:hypothetical protein
MNVMTATIAAEGRIKNDYLNSQETKRRTAQS